MRMPTQILAAAVVAATVHSPFPQRRRRSRNRWRWAMPTSDRSIRFNIAAGIVAATVAAGTPTAQRLVLAMELREWRCRHVSGLLARMSGRRSRPILRLSELDVPIAGWQGGPEARGAIRRLLLAPASATIAR